MRKPRRLFSRLRFAFEAFRYSRYDGTPGYAVIFDSYEGLNRETDDPREEFYEVFGSPGQAAAMYADAYGRDESIAENPRLVMILGPMKKYPEDQRWLM